MRAFGSFGAFGTFVAFGALLAVGAMGVSAQTQVLTLKGTSANVATPGTPVNIQLFRWSSDAERTPLLAALAPPAPAPAPVDAAAGRAGAGGRAAGRGGRAGRGGAAAAPASPVALLSAAITAAPTIGFLWTDGVTGYSIKYAWRAPLANGAERIVLATDRRLGAHSPAWTLPPAAAAPDYDFTLIELQLDAKGLGEAKTSLTARVVADTAANTLALDGYAAAPTLLKVSR